MAGGKMTGKDLGLLVLRLGLGGIMIAHGVVKLQKFGVNGFAQYLADKGFPGPHQAMAIAVLAGEIGGGALVVLGLLAQLGALAIAAIMVGAIIKVHYVHGFFLVTNAEAPIQGPIPHGAEFCVALLAMALCILFAGPGALAFRLRKGGGKPPG